MIIAPSARLVGGVLIGRGNLLLKIPPTHYERIGVKRLRTILILYVIYPDAMGRAMVKLLEEARTKGKK